ncbi:hypothetical protein HNP48_006683 [Acidovorax soli]|uniref:Uncharacterized protein n=1 Tax=Acidovorax soli TaxID=592050 RepID=A0A7X0UCZ8_9BURK|nr:hypothetical protein [Acidovorax soli]MBB6563957.1 hypothetical protein [Acidovorax soli]
MAQTLFDDPRAATTILNRAFTDQSPSYAAFNNQVAMATSMGLEAFALEFGARFAGLSEDQLSTHLLGNLGALPNAGLQTALKDYLVFVGKAQVGIVALQLGQILSGLEHATGEQAVFHAAAVAWNKELADAYAYSSNPYGLVTFPAGGTLVGVLVDGAGPPVAVQAGF